MVIQKAPSDYPKQRPRSGLNTFVRCSRFANKEQEAYLYGMKAHNGMRPHDVVVLLKILISDRSDWQYRDLSASLYISISEIAESLNRSHIAGLIDESRRKVHRQSLMEFIRYGLHYVFPQLPGTMVSGLPTAHAHPFYQELLVSEVRYVWPDENGEARGLSILPLYKNAVKAAKNDPLLYQLLASIDIIRVGRAREIGKALKILEQHILVDEPERAYSKDQIRVYSPGGAG